MKLSDLMQGKTPSPTYAGFATNDDFVLAVDTGTGGTQTAVGDYSVVQSGISKAEASVDAETKDKIFIRTGKHTTKTGAQRKFVIEGDRLIGDAFQDFCLSNPVLYGAGAAVERGYVYFNALTGKGEQGVVTIVPSDTQTGDQNDNAQFKADLTSTATPADYTYSSGS